MKFLVLLALLGLAVAQPNQQQCLTQMSQLASTCAGALSTGFTAAGIAPPPAGDLAALGPALARGVQNPAFISAANPNAACCNLAKAVAPCVCNAQVMSLVSQAIKIDVGTIKTLLSSAFPPKCAAVGVTLTLPSC